MNIYVVQPGDTIYSIAQAYGVDPQLLIRDNDIVPERLVIGQTLVIQNPTQMYVVQPGDSLFSIAARYGMTTKQLLRNNYFLHGSQTIVPGTTLVISYAGEKLGPMSVNGYAYEFVNLYTLQGILPYATYLSPFTYGFTEDGSLVLLEDGALLQEARQYAVVPWMHLSTLTEYGYFSNALASSILRNRDLWPVLLSNILAVMEEKGYQGLDIDFEYVFPEENILYVEFVAYLRENLNGRGYPVIVALVPKTSRDQPGAFYEGHLYRELGEAADAVLLMTYEWGYTYSPPMAVAPLPSVRRVLDYAVTEIPPEKIFMGMPNYGYDWTLPYIKGESRAKVIGNVEAVEIAFRYGAEISYDSYAQTPYFQYTDNEGNRHEVWFEDARSIDAKLRTAFSYGFQGLGYWNFMRPFPQNFLLLNALFDIR